MMAKALTQAFRISAEALDVGLNEWDFSAVQKDSTDACDPNLTWHFNGSRNRKSHGIGVQLVMRFAAF